MELSILNSTNAAYSTLTTEISGYTKVIVLTENWTNGSNYPNLDIKANRGGFSKKILHEYKEVINNARYIGVLFELSNIENNTQIQMASSNAWSGCVIGYK